MEGVWTHERVSQLSVLWQEGHSTAEIGRRLGISKNAVVGKAHRLLLDPRPSPLKTKPAPKVPAVAAPEPAPAPAPRVVGFSGPSCSWPHGHPGERGFHFCGARPIPGKPYCAEHAALAYIRPKNHGSNAA
jgi:GcrA cell cycle regulator